MSALLSLQNVVKRFPVETDFLGRTTKSLTAVAGVSLDVKPGEALGIVGESGSGKSTLGRIMLRLLDASEGRVLFEGRDITDLGASEMRRLRGDMQMVFQDPYSALNPRLKVFHIIAEPLINAGLPKAEIAGRVNEVLRVVGLSPEHASRYPHAFSGGQRQRIGIARALAANPRLIVCDEAVSALDVSVQAQILNLLREIQRTQVALVFISHNLGVVRFLCDRVAVLYLGRIVELADEAALFNNPQHPYTQALLAAIPEPDHGRRGRVAVPTGEIPDAIDPPTGCVFHPRCPRARDICRTVEPTLDAKSPGHRTACHFPGPAAGIAKEENRT